MTAVTVDTVVTVHPLIVSTATLTLPPLSLIANHESRVCNLRIQDTDCSDASSIMADILVSSQLLLVVFRYQYVCVSNTTATQPADQLGYVDISCAEVANAHLLTLSHQEDDIAT